MDRNEAVRALARAWEFAAHKHTDQRRKGSRGEPYVNHLAEVADLLAEATDGRDPVLVIAGVLHDTVEDTPTTKAEIEALFGADVAALVLEVTDDKTLPKAERKRLQVERAPHKSPRARMLKLADKISNLRAITHSPPSNWDERRRREYVDWAAAVAQGCRGVNADLEARFDEARAAAYAAIDAVVDADPVA